MHVILECAYSFKASSIVSSGLKLMELFSLETSQFHCRRLSHADESRAEGEAGWEIMNSQQSLSRLVSVEA